MRDWMYVGCVTGGGYIDGDGVWRVFHLLVRRVWPGVGPVIRVQHPPHTHPDPLHDGEAFHDFRPSTTHCLVQVFLNL